MKTNSTHLSRRWRGVSLAVLALALAFLPACREQHDIVWSPDGRHAAVLAQDGLHLSDAAGHLSPLLIPGVKQAVWLADSTRLVLSRAHEFEDWAGAAKLLGPARTTTLAAAAESAWKEVQAGATWEAVLKKAPGGTGDFYKVYLRERHGPELEARLTMDEWKTVRNQTLVACEMLTAHLEGDKIVTGIMLQDSLGDSAVDDIRLSPDGRAAAFTFAPWPESGDAELMVAMLDGSVPPTKIAGAYVLSPDWTPDSRDLVSVEAAVTEGHNDGLVLGALVQRQIFDETGRFATGKEPRYLAGLIPTGNTRVRCLRDGRILFNAAEITLPLATDDYGDQREQLFALDPARQSTLVHLVPRKHLADLPQALARFEVSPDEKQILFSGEKGEVCVLTVTSGDVEVVQTAGPDDIGTTPTWRNAGEFTYEKRAVAPDGKPLARPMEIMLRHGKDETVLSAGWPDDFIKLLK